MSLISDLRNRWKVEPGLSIRKRITDFVLPLKVGHKRKVSELYALLERLPMRNTVPNGRDFRGIPDPSFVGFCFHEADFSYATNCRFIACDLTGSKLAFIQGESAQITKVLSHASFRGAKLRRMYLSKTVAQHAIFDDASLRASSFAGSDLRGASFRNADCRDATFHGANLQGCDFRGANLDGAVVQKVTVDATTDFRGASLINAFVNDEVDPAGYTTKGLDLNVVRIDGDTRLGTDAAAAAIDELARMLIVLKEVDDPSYSHLRQVLTASLEQLKIKFEPAWHDRMAEQLSEDEMDMLTDISWDAGTVGDDE